MGVAIVSYEKSTKHFSLDLLLHATIVTQKKSNYTSNATTIQKVNEWLLNSKDLLLKQPIDVVLIEKQSPKSSLLQMISGCLCTFVQVYCTLTNIRCPDIRYQSGSKKLKIVVCPEETLADFSVEPSKGQWKSGSWKKNTQAQQWKSNKNHCLENFTRLLNLYSTGSQWVSYVSLLKKKDDVSDATMQAVYYLFKQKGIKTIYLHGDKVEPKISFVQVGDAKLRVVDDVVDLTCTF